MTWNYVYTPTIWPSIGTAILLLGLTLFGWRRRSLPGVLPFAVSCLFAALLSIGIILTSLAANPETLAFWRRFEDIWWLPAVTATTCFILEYARPGRWLNLRNLVLISIVPTLATVYLLTADYNNLIPLSFKMNGYKGGSFGQLGLILYGYTLILLLINFIVFIWLFLHSPQHRWPVVIMAAGQIAARVFIILNSPAVAGMIRLIPEHAFPYLAYTIALFGFRIFDPVPLARQTAIEQLNIGMLVMDQKGFIASLNPSAERMLGISMEQGKGRPVNELIPAYPDWWAAHQNGTETEFCFGKGKDIRYYMLAGSPLKDFRGLEVGHLLMLRDVTEQKQTQEQVLKQQGVVATLKERERMARELHDSLGQVLSYTSLQVEAAVKLCRDGQVRDAEAQLGRLGTVIRDAHADLREHILNLRANVSDQQPFFPAIEQYLDSFTSSYDLQTHLAVAPSLEDINLSPDTQLQVFRILQEALSNARKHGRARQVQVAFSKNDGRVNMIVQDDGCGFAPDQVCLDGKSHYGLQFMQERALQLGGSLRVQSVSGAGTVIELEIPIKED